MRISDWSSDVCSSDLDLGERRLDIAADLGKVVLRVARRTEHPCVAPRSVRRAGELVLLAAQVHADGGLHFTAGQFETQAPREARTEDRAGTFAAVPLPDPRRRRLQCSQPLRAPLPPPPPERVPQARPEAPPAGKEE